METGHDKTKIVTNNPGGLQRKMKIKSKNLEEVKRFKYLGAIISSEGDPNRRKVLFFKNCQDNSRCRMKAL